MFSYQFSVLSNQFAERTVDLMIATAKLPEKKKPTWCEAGTWASKLGLDKELRSNAPVARGERPTTTAGGGEASEALANDEHI